MKNNFLKFLIVGVFFFYNSAFSESFTLKTKKIEILKNENQINAYEGKAISKDNNLEIRSDKFIYLKNTDLLRS